MHPAEKALFISDQFDRLWRVTATSPSGREARRDQMQREWIRVFSALEPCDVLKRAVDLLIEDAQFLPTIAEVRAVINANYEDWVPEDLRCTDPHLDKPHPWYSDLDQESDELDGKLTAIMDVFGDQPT